MNSFKHSFLFVSLLSLCAVSCAHREAKVEPKDAARLEPRLVRETVVYGPGAETGAVVPEISAPRLRAEWIREKVENGRLVEAHREWVLEGDVIILGTPPGEAPSASQKGAR
jgi:hypothetical protein